MTVLKNYDTISESFKMPKLLGKRQWLRLLLKE